MPEDIEQPCCEECSCLTAEAPDTEELVLNLTRTAGRSALAAGLIVAGAVALRRYPKTTIALSLIGAGGIIGWRRYTED